MSNSTTTKNDREWERLFQKYDVLASIQSKGQYVIKSQTINEFREARLMTKFDHSSNLPTLFRDHQLAILPVTRGEYVIAPIKAYEPIDSHSKPEIIYMDFPSHIESIEYSTISSEATAINCAYVSGILEDFLEEEHLSPTVSGRMNSGIFTFSIDSSLNAHSLTFQVNHSQIEIDGGFEGLRSLALIEAKLSVTSDFLIRQLYYPYRLWKQKVTKEVVPVLLLYSNGVFDLYRYTFKNPDVYNSIKLVKHARYSLEPMNISLGDIQHLLDNTVPLPEPEIPFPQADSFTRVVNLCELLFEEGSLSQEEVTTMYDFDVRQTIYYSAAGIYLGLIEKYKDKRVRYCLTDKGKELFKKGYRERQLSFVELILQHSVFAETLRLWLYQAEMPTKNQVIAIMHSSSLHNVQKPSVYKRRSQTIISWLKWVVDLQT